MFLPIIKYVTNTALVMKDGWSWIKGPWGAKVLLYAVSNPEFSTKYNANLLMCTPKDQLEVGRGQGDVFSSPHSTILFLRKLLSCFGYGIFWEIAVRTIARCILCEYLSISLSTKWDKSRGTPPPLGTKAYVF